MIIIYTLPECSFCKSTIDGLHKAGIPYNTVNVMENTALADKLEDTVNTAIYPIVQIIKDNSVTYLISEILDPEYYNENIAVDSYYGIPNLLHKIKQHI